MPSRRLRNIASFVKVFVAGGTGAIGFPSVHALTLRGHKVYATARGEEKASLLRAIGVEPVFVDIYDLAALRRAIRGCDAVIRLTTKLSGPMTAMRSRRFWSETNRLRTSGARLLVDAAIAESVGTFISESFYSVYCDAGESFVDERSETNGGGIETLEAALKGESEALSFTATGGSGIVLRFGAYYSPEAASTLETIRLASRRLFPLIGGGSLFISSIYLDDAAQAVAHALSAPAGVYNVCDDEPVQFSVYLRTLAGTLGAKMPLGVPGFLGSALMGYPWHWLSRSVRMENAKLKAATAWSPKVRSIRDGWSIVVSCAVRECLTS